MRNTMQDSFIPVDARTKTHLKKKRCRKVSEEPAKLECADERDTPSIVEVAGQEFQAQTRQKKSKLLKSVHDTHDLVSTAKNLISDFEDIALVSSSDDSESTLSIDDVLDEKKYAPSTLVWARIQQNRAITMWPSEVIDPACGINVEVPECPSFLAGQKPQILVYYFGKKKFGWHEKSELKLFGEIDAENAKDGMSRSFQQAVNKALKKFKKVAQSSSQRMKTSLDAIQSKAIGCKSNVKQLKARRKKSAPNLLIEPFITSESSISLETQKKSRHAHIKCLTSTACASRKKTNIMKSIKSSRDMSKKVKGAANTKQQTTEGTEDIFLSCMCQAVVERLKTTVHKYEAGDGYHPISRVTMIISSRTNAISHFENFQSRNNRRWVQNNPSKFGNTHWTIKHSRKINQFLGLPDDSVFETTFDRKYRMEGRNFLHEGKSATASIELLEATVKKQRIFLKLTTKLQHVA